MRHSPPPSFTRAGPGEEITQEMSASTKKKSRRPRLKWVLGGLALVVIVVVAVVVLGGGSSSKKKPPGGTLKAGKQQLLPLSPSGRIAAQPGQNVTGKSMAVRTIVKGKGFWIGGSDVDRVYVVYSGPAGPEGTKVDLAATVKPAPGNVEKALGLQPQDTAKVTAEAGYLKASSVTPAKNP
jgi:hypothetical protein